MIQFPKNIFCNNCGSILDCADGNSVERQPCPNCSSTSRRFEEEIKLSIIPKFYLQYKYIKEKIKGKKRKRPSYQEECGDDRYEKTQEWMKLTRIYDRTNRKKRNRWYFEAIVNPATNEVIHYTSERLSDHKGHGSAKDKLKE